MDLLFDLYRRLYRIRRDEGGAGTTEGRMAAWVTLITICAVAIPFYLRFVVALYREYRRERRAHPNEARWGRA
jgi:NADH:ubiquinone oxidoreductase subunit 2 (subunit N)